MAKKYFFGYYGVFGIANSVKWVEDDGVSVGGKIEILHEQRWEITRQQYLHTKLTNLSAKYPYKPLG